jgi:hypothetical protein
MNRRIGSMLVAVALAVSASAAWACDGHADAKDTKDAKAVTASGGAKGCSMPCCAKAKAAAVAEKPSPAHDAKGGPETAVVASDALKTKPVQAAPPVASAADAGTHR